MRYQAITDERGIVSPCPACGTSNRVAYGRLGQEGRCGSCQTAFPQVGVPVEISSQEAFAALLSRCSLPIVVDFWAPWCGPCKMMAPEFARAAAQGAGRAIFAKVNTDEQVEIASRFRIQGIPAFALIRDGQVRAETAGFQTAQRLLDWLRQR